MLRSKIHPEKDGSFWDVFSLFLLMIFWGGFHGISISFELNNVYLVLTSKNLFSFQWAKNPSRLPSIVV